MSGVEFKTAELLPSEDLDQFRVSLPGDEHFQKFIAKKTNKESEVRVTLASGRIIEGFITGLDEDWIQITTSKKKNEALVNLATVGSVEITGRHIKDLPKQDQEAIRGFAFALKKRCQTELRASQLAKG